MTMFFVASDQSSGSVAQSALGRFREASMLVAGNREMGMRLLLVWLVVLVVSASAQNTPAASAANFPGTYAQLKPEQKKLIDDWYAEYDRLMGENDPPTDYDQLSLSTRTTFEAVTHALMTTKLTDNNRQSMGNALDLVQSIETINGKIPKARGDLQFRVYVILRPEALQTLRKSTEFFRDRDNTVYHHGYPLNWRQDGGAPSIQISMAPDGRHADIDVDYRSSGFPQALFNGHLTAANSDVRAGNNTQRHLQRWQGLADWWRNLFALDIPEASPEQVAEATGDVPPIPRKGSGRVDDAMLDFLTSWLVEQRPELSAAYLSPRSFSCLEEYGPQSGNEISVAAAPYLAAKDLAVISKALGKPAKLQDVVVAYPVDDNRLKKIKQQYADLFALYAVPDGVAPEFECDDQRALKDFENARLTGMKRKHSQYYASVLRLKQPHESGQVLTILWSKEGAYWKIISWDIEPEDTKPHATPDTRTSTAETVEPQVKGDAALLQVSHDFLRAWLIKRDYAAATNYFAPRSYSCIDAVVAPDQPKPSSPSQYLNYMQTAMQTIAQDVEIAQHLPDVIEPAEPDHPGLKLVRHQGEEAYTLVAVPDELVPVLTCGQETREHPFTLADETAEKYGNYYDQLFAIRTPGNHPASLSFLWGKDSGQWKIVSYQMITP